VLVGTVAVAPELIKSMQDQQLQLTQALLDRAKGICADHGVCPVDLLLSCKLGLDVPLMHELFR
jgi:hypothetical protein